ncbi:MAG: SGNH/GDSL hydrolase family protein [Bacteroidaceae bacterium]|nr:SGNH/GDSL hydrolase family protein [Bacteroidaceae bacterium]
MKRQALLLSLALLCCAPTLAQTMIVLGDSYVANHRRPRSEAWHSQVAERHGWQYRNYGRNGSSIAWDRERFGPRMVQRCLEMTDTADLVLVIAGHNDATMIGHSRDSLRMFRDSLDLLCQRLRQKYPRARIGFVTPWHVDRPGFRPVIRAIHHTCRRHHIPVLDTRRSPIRVRDDAFRRQYFQAPDDHAHLNAAGHQLALPWGERFLLRLMQQDK